MKEEKNFDITRDYISGAIPGQLFFSNAVENLFERLKENLFPPESTPFSKRLVIVPSLAMEKWIRMRLAEDLGVSAGISTSFLENALRSLFDIEALPTKLELILHIESELDSIKERWEPIRLYLAKERKGLSLAKQLASLFTRYGIYGNTACARWEREPQNWQEDLWQRVFRTWNYPLRLIPSLRSKEYRGEVHLFSFSHIPPLYFHFFQQLPAVYFYQLSPSQEFWSDLSTEHPLLTHFGRVGREMAKLVEESNLVTEELYTIPEGETQLERLQKELLFLEEGEKTPDDSIQLHSAQSPHHEIRTLHTILDQLEYEPREILVMAPDISIYEPYIRAIFKEYQIADMPLHTSHPQVEGLFLLLDLEKRRFSAPALLELFHHPLFQKKIGWNEEELLQLRNWIRSTGIRWGLNKENRDALLKKRLCPHGIEDEAATWKGGIDLLIEELALPRDPKRIDFTQAELLGEWRHLIDQLGSDLLLLQQRLTILGWIDLLKRLHALYFAESDVVVSYLENLRFSARHLPGRTYSFESIRLLVQEAIGEKNMTVNGNQLHTIRFCSMLPMRSIPAKVICLIGMNHDAFPRKESLFSLDLLKEEGDYSPSRLDFDRYLFLEALLSAREKLIISYVGCDPYDQTPWPPSSAVTQLLPYISQTIKHSIELPIKEREERPPLFTYHPGKIEIPACQIDLTDFVRPFRSPLRHFLHHRDLFVRDERVIQEEEAFQFSALRLAIASRAGANGLKNAKREGDFPLGPFAAVAEEQILAQVALLPQAGLTERINVQIGPVHLIGTLEGVLPSELSVYEKMTMKGAARAWPLFLVYALVHPEARALLFAREGKKVDRFFDDPTPHLERALRYYFLSQQIPTPLFPEWIEPILKQDPDKLAKAQSFDPSLRWALRGQKVLPPDQLIAQWGEETDKLYREMRDAWF